MKGTIDDRYFEWLYRHIGSVKNRNPAESYWELARVLYTTQFEWFVHNDDNRVADGKALRYEFIEDWGSEGVDQTWLDLGCSMLEMIIALSYRVAYNTNRPPGEEFWHLMTNLDLAQYNDAKFRPSSRPKIELVLDRLNRRTYERDGTGGLFPLRRARRDQRRIEIWYQMQAYLIEMEEAEAAS